MAWKASSRFVCSYPNDGASCRSDRGSIRAVRRSNPHLANRKAKFAKSKVSSLLFLRSRDSRKFNFDDFVFFHFFDSASALPSHPAGPAVGSAEEKIVQAHSDSLCSNAVQRRRRTPRLNNPIKHDWHVSGEFAYSKRTLLSSARCGNRGIRQSRIISQHP